MNTSSFGHQFLSSLIICIVFFNTWTVISPFSLFLIHILLIKAFFKILYIFFMEQKTIRQFILNQIQKTTQLYLNQTSDEQKLRNSCKLHSYAQMLNLYFDEDKYLGDAFKFQAESYFNLENYDQALIRARLARNKLEVFGKQRIQQINFLIARCLLKSKKIEDAKQILLSMDPCVQQIKYLMLKLQIFSSLQENNKIIDGILQDIENVSSQTISKGTIQNGTLLIQKGQVLLKLHRYQLAMQNFREGLDIFIKNKYTDKLKVANVYENLALCANNLSDYDNQFTSLICAESMVRNLSQNKKKHINIIQKIITNLMNRQSHEQALQWLFKVQSYEKNFYGEYSENIGKTTKLICTVLNALGRRAQSKKYEQEYRKILGSCSVNMQSELKNEKNLNLCNKLQTVDINRVI